MKRALWPLLAGVVATATLWLWPKTATNPPDTPPTTASTITASPTAQATNETPPIQTEQTFPVSKHLLRLKGDQLLPTPDIVAMFNEWVAATQSQRYEEWRSVKLLQANDLPEQAQQQLAKWLDQYAEYNLALQLMALKGEPSWDNILSNLREARGLYFQEQDKGLFDDQIALEDFTEKAVNAFSDDNNPLSTLVELERQVSALPPGTRPAVDAMLAQLTKALQQDSSISDSPEEWNRLVQSTAAATLANPSVDLNEASADFLKRYNAYSEERARMRQEGATEDQLRVLRETRFAGSERLRANTLDKALDD